MRTFCEFYNESWSDPENGFPLLSESEFMKKIRLNGINYDIEDEKNDALFLYFSESGLFGGHAIEIFWESNDEMSADIVG